MIRMAALLIYRAITRRFGRLAIAFAGVALAISCLVLLEGVMVGVGDAMIYNSVALHHGHIAVSWEGDAPAFEDLANMIPQAQAILTRKRHSGALTYGNREAHPTLYGVIPEQEREQTVIASKIVQGSYIGTDLQGIVIGALLAEQLGVAVGDTLSFQQAGGPPLARQLKGIYRTGIELFDARTGFTALEAVPQGKLEAAIFLKAGEDAEALAENLQQRGLAATPWPEALAEVDQLIDLNSVSMNIVLGLAVLILAFGVSNTVFISVAERAREFGILKALGFTPGAIQVLVLLEVVLLVGLAGTLGMAVGLGAAKVWAVHGIDLSRWTSENRHFLSSGVVYPRLTLRSFVLPGMAALICGMLAALLPARRAGQIQVAEALRQL